MGVKRLLNKVKCMPQGAKASIAFFFANLITTGISYLITPIYTRLLSTAEYGQVSVFQTWVQLLGIVAMFCLSYGVFNNGMIDYPDKRDEYSFSILILSNVITICFSVILFCLYPMLQQWLKLDFAMLVLMSIVFLVQPAYNFWTSRQRYELQYKYSVCWSIVAGVLSPAVAIITMLLFPSNKLYGRIFGAQIPLIVIYVGFYIFLGIKAKFKVNTTYWKDVLCFNFPLIPHYLSTYLLSSSDKIMISELIGDSYTAYYSIAYSVASVTIIVWSAVNSSLLPFTYEKCKQKNYDAISKVTIPILTIFVGISVLIVLLAPEVVHIMATEDYKEAIYAIPPIVGGVFFQLQYYIYANIVYYYKKPKYVMFASITAALVNVVLNYLCIPLFGYIAAGYTTIVCYLIQAIIDFFAMKKVVGESVYNMRSIIFLSILMIIIVLISNFLYLYSVLRYGVILLLIGLVVIFRKKIVSLFVMIQQKN